MNKTKIKVCDLDFHYGKHHALKSVDIDIPEHAVTAIIGPSGCGKSTLLRHLNGLQMPGSGSVRIAGKEIREWNRKELSKTAALVFQNPDHQIFNASVREEVEFGPRQLGFSEQQRTINVERAIRTMDLEEQQSRDPFQLSKGERQRVAVASVLSVNPRILMLDEPTTGLDYRQQSYLMKLLQELNQDGATIIIVTHNLKLVGETCNYAVFMENGRMRAEGHPRTLFFQDSLFPSMPPLWDLAWRLKGNALTVSEFASSIRSR